MKKRTNNYLERLTRVSTAQSRYRVIEALQAIDCVEPVYLSDDARISSSTPTAASR